MKNILVTGATGNVGKIVIKYLFHNQTKNKIIAGVRNIARARELLDYEELDFIYFDFEDSNSFSSALKNVDTIFLLRPPHISNVKKYFNPLIDAIIKNGIKEIVFLSVQGAEKSNFIPHHKIENLILSQGVNYIFLRPGYFMENLTTTLLSDIKNGLISLPAGNAKFNWVDVENVGEVAALVLEYFSSYQNQNFILTGPENLNFHEVTSIMSEITKREIKYQNLNPLSFYFKKKSENMERGLIIVMIMLHFLPRLQKEPEISTDYHKLTGKTPNNIKKFINRNKNLFN